jgi:hypothetical protein
MNQTAEFVDALRSGIEQDTFARLVMAKYRGPDPEMVRTTVRPVVIKDQKCLSFVRHYRTRDITENLAVAAGIEAITGLIGNTFKAAHLLLASGDIHLEFSRKGKCRLTRGTPTLGVVQPAEHDIEKKRMIDRRKPFLDALGITGKTGQVLPSMSHKWKQINRFIEVFDQVINSSGLAAQPGIDVVDFGCGKGYLTFAVHDYLCGSLGLKATVTGVELRENLVSFCNKAKQELNCVGLCFKQGDVGSYKSEKTDVLIALHACDTATDLAIHRGISAGASIIMCAPCCHKQIRPQMTAPDILKPVMRFGSHLAQEAEMVTDGLRALLLETQGYSVSVFEFISLEHTDKNKMILGIRRPGVITDQDRVWAQIKAIKDFYGIREHELETLLKSK